MKVSLLRWAFLLIMLTLGIQRTQAQDFVYEPKNPAFGGGNTFNYSWMLSAAQSQNSLKDPNAPTAASLQQDPLQQFQQSLNQQLLSQLAQRLVGNQFGSSTQSLQAGNYTIGAYQIGVTPNTGGGFSVQITDTGTGNQTTITVPGL